jgi:hypothetical protein
MHVLKPTILLGFLLLSGASVTAAQTLPASCGDGMPAVAVPAYGLWLCDVPSRSDESTEVKIAVANGLGAREGFVPGDRIYQVAGEPVQDAAHTATRMGAAEGTWLLVNFRRHGAAYLVRLPVRGS